MELAVFTDGMAQRLLGVGNIIDPLVYCHECCRYWSLSSLKSYCYENKSLVYTKRIEFEGKPVDRFVFYYINEYRHVCWSCHDQWSGRI